jgi:hypothetical protein
MYRYHRHEKEGNGGGTAGSNHSARGWLSLLRLTVSPAEPGREGHRTVANQAGSVIPAQGIEEPTPRHRIPFDNAISSPLSSYTYFCFSLLLWPDPDSEPIDSRLPAAKLQPATVLKFQGS